MWTHTIIVYNYSIELDWGFPELHTWSLSRCCFHLWQAIQLLHCLLKMCTYEHGYESCMCAAETLKMNGMVNARSYPHWKEISSQVDDRSGIDGQVCDTLRHEFWRQVRCDCHSGCHAYTCRAHREWLLDSIGRTHRLDAVTWSSTLHRILSRKDTLAGPHWRRYIAPKTRKATELAEQSCNSWEIYRIGTSKFMSCLMNFLERKPGYKCKVNSTKLMVRPTTAVENVSTNAPIYCNCWRWCAWRTLGHKVLKEIIQ